MTTEKAIEFGKIFLKSIEDEKGSATYEFVETAIKMMEQQPILDKIRAEIEAIEAGISSYHDDRPWIFKDEALAIIDKYKAESEDEE